MIKQFMTCHYLKYHYYFKLLFYFYASKINYILIIIYKEKFKNSSNCSLNITHAKIVQIKLSQSDTVLGSKIWILIFELIITAKFVSIFIFHISFLVFIESSNYTFKSN